MDGFSIEMWHEYYPRAEIVGLDIMPKDHRKIGRAPEVTLLQLNATDIPAMMELASSTSSWTTAVT